MSDDYLFDDDIVLDADALAILDAEESKYFGTLANVQPNPRSAPTQPTPPPAKRRRTDDDGGWKHTAKGVRGQGSSKLVSQNLKRSDSFYEDLPNISLAGDGVYGVYSQGSQLPRNSNLTSADARSVKDPPLGQRPQPAGFQQQPTPAPVPAPAPLPRERTLTSNQIRPPPTRLPLQRTLTPPSNVPHNPNNSNRPLPQQQSRQQQPPHPQQQTRNGSVPPQPNRAHNLGHGRNLGLPRQRLAPAPAQPVQSRSPNFAGGATDNGLQEEVARLKTQLEEVRVLLNRRLFISLNVLFFLFHGCR